MSDKTSMLGSLGNRLREGINRINQEAKDRAEGKAPDSHPIDELSPESADSIQEEVTERTSKKGGDEPLFALDDDMIDEGLIIEGDAQPQKPKSKGLDKKQKLLLIAAVIIGGVYWTSSQGPAQMPTEDLQGEAQQSTPQEGEVPVPTFELGNAQGTDKPIETIDEPVSFALSGSNSQTSDAANDPIGTDLLTADLNEQLTSLSEEGNEILDPFSGEVKAFEPPPSALIEQAKTPDLGAELGLASSEEDSPFSGGDSNSTELSGTNSQNADSKAGVLQDQSANADVAILKAKAEEKDGRISKLEAEVSKLKTDLANAKQEVAQAKAGAAPTGAKPQPTPAKSTPPQRSTPTQRVAAPKVVARPQICVTALAQAARNCSTCVPHAFITHQGSETMLGQGDFIEGLRVNIVGDRLDLQNAQGDVVHKFWSSPNGCTAG